MNLENFILENFTPNFFL